MIIMDAEKEWPGDKNLNELIAEWTKKRGESDRLYPGAMVWCFKKSGREFREKVELLLAWKRQRKTRSGQDTGLWFWQIVGSPMG